MGANLEGPRSAAIGPSFVELRGASLRGLRRLSIVSGGRLRSDVVVWRGDSVGEWRGEGLSRAAGANGVGGVTSLETGVG